MSLTYIPHWVLTCVIFQLCDSYAIIFSTLSMFMGYLYIYVLAMIYMSKKKWNLSDVSACGTNTVGI